MKFGSVCSGIEAASVAWNPLGWRAEFVSEIDRFPCEVLEHHHGSVPNRGDMTKFKEWPDATIDVLVGGTPCQSFSVAGLRKGLDDPRGNLMLTYLAIAARYRPEWLVWENVPGGLSSGEGRDFGSLLGGLAELGYGFAYRILDAQYFGLAQRRQRVFVVGCLGGWRRAAAVLFERASLQGNPAPSRETGKNIAAPIAGCSNGGGANGPGRSADDAQNMIFDTLREHPRPGSNTVGNVALALQRGQRMDGESETFVPVSGTLTGSMGRRAGAPNDDNPADYLVTHALRAEVTTNDTAGSLKNGGGKPGQGYPAVQSGMAVRRLTPMECERLQGFPDDYTLIQRKGKPAADGPRYKALGNSMAVPVMAWIGKRIDMCSQSTSGEKA